MFGQETASVGSLRSKLDIKHYALELATKIAPDKVLEKAKEIEDYLLKDTEIPIQEKPVNPMTSLIEAIAAKRPEKEGNSPM